MQNSQKQIPHFNNDLSRYAELRSECVNNGNPVPMILASWMLKPGQGEADFIDFEALVLHDRQTISPYKVKRILESGDRVIVFWEDGDKTIVKRSEGTNNDIYNAFTAALAIKIYGNNSQVKRLIDRKHEHIEKCDGKSLVIDNYEMRKQRRKWDKEYKKDGKVPY